MVQNNILQLMSIAKGQFIYGDLMSLADRISGIFLVILAIAVLFEFTKTGKKDELIKERSFVAVSLMGVFLAIQFIIGRIGIGRLDLELSTTNVFVILGCLAVILGVILNLVARVQLGSNWSNSVVIYREQTLVNKGLYSVVRHPLYTTIFLISIGLAIQYVNYISLIIAFVIFLPMLYMRIIQEEKVLRKHLNGYIEYEKSVPMFFPFSFRSFFSVHEAQINSWALRACRTTTVVLLLFALYFHIFWLVVLTFILMLSSTIFSISHSPIIFIYKSIFVKLGVLKEEVVDVNAIRFAQGLGSFLLLCSMLLLCVYNHPFGGWVFVSIVAFSTAFGSLGYCMGAYIYFFLRRIYQYGK